MAHTENTIEAGMRSQETFEQMVNERLRQAVRVSTYQCVGGGSDGLHRSKAV